MKVSQAFQSNIKCFDLDAGAHCPIFVAAATISSDSGECRRTASGWGRSRDEARAKCLNEAVERMHTVWSPTVRTTAASYDDLRGVALDPADHILLSERQYLEREAWNIKSDAAHHHPSAFTPSKVIEWVEGCDVETGELVYVPAAVVFLGYPDAIKHGFPVPDSNGCAAGTNIADAIGRAILEVVERDAVSIWWYNEVAAPPADGTDIPLFGAMSAWARRNERELWLLDLTTDLGVPVVVALTCDNHGGDFSVGFGSGWTMSNAITSALGELVQFDLSRRIARSSGAGARNLPFLETMSSLRRKSARFLVPDASKTATSLHKSDVTLVLAAFRERGIQPVSVDLSTNEAVVVRVIAPGLRPIWPRFAAGRLYNVPVEMGWLAAPTAEQELNPLPILY